MSSNKWLSLSALKNEVVETSVSNEARSPVDCLNDLVLSIEGIETTKEAFETLCHVSQIFETLDPSQTERLIKDTNLYIATAFEVFNNSAFKNTIADVVDSENTFSFNKSKGNNVEEKKSLTQ